MAQDDAECLLTEGLALVPYTPNPVVPVAVPKDVDGDCWAEPSLRERSLTMATHVSCVCSAASSVSQPAAKQATQALRGHMHGWGATRYIDR